MVAQIKLVSETPGWWNPRGHHMHIGITGTVLTGGKADLALDSKDSVDAFVRIDQVYSRNKYKLGWHLNHSGGIDMPYTAGRIEVDARELKRMFAFIDGAEEDSLWLLKQYRGTAAAQGKFLRQNRYLNIPGPGTGRDGDANLSVFVSDEIMTGVRAMLISKGHM